MNCESIRVDHPHVAQFFEAYSIDLPEDTRTVSSVIKELKEETFQDIGVDRDHILENLQTLLNRLEDLSTTDKGTRISSIEIFGGRDKKGINESVRLTITPGEIIGIVGPTGSGKSRLLADIEWMAQGDTPTGRTILIDGVKPDKNLRFSLEHKLVAQLSQNMNFVMDATVGEFVNLHAESRLINDSRLVQRIIEEANALAGETFTKDTPVTALSGGQSRALMIADTAFLSKSPIVLIDEIENAGIDRKKALSLLVNQEKIVLIATHDPILALLCDKRIVIKNGGIHALLTTTNEERNHLDELQKIDGFIQTMRDTIRRGDRIDFTFPVRS